MEDQEIGIIVVTGAYAGPERRTSSCPVCRSDISGRPGMVTCGSRECVSEYHRRLMPKFKAYESRRQYHEWLFWWNYRMEDAMRVAGLESSADSLYR